MAEKTKILLVDDDKFMLEFVKAQLNVDKYNVSTCIDSVLALDLIKKGDEAPDIVISDIMMPDMDGLELLKKIKEIKPSLPVVFITAYANVDTAIEAVEAGAADFVRKPVKPELLEKALEKAVSTLS